MSRNSTSVSRPIHLNVLTANNNTQRQPLLMARTVDRQALHHRSKIPTPLHQGLLALLQPPQEFQRRRVQPPIMLRNIHNTMALKPRVPEAPPVKLIHMRLGVVIRTTWLTISITCNSSSKDRVLMQRLRHLEVVASSHLHRHQAMELMETGITQCHRRPGCESN